MSHEDDVRDELRRDVPGGSGVGTDGSLHSPEEPSIEHGADHSAEKGDGVGTDGSLVNPEKEVVDPGDVRDPDRTDRGSGMNPH